LKELCTYKHGKVVVVEDVGLDDDLLAADDAVREVEGHEERQERLQLCMCTRDYIIMVFV